MTRFPLIKHHPSSLIQYYVLIDRITYLLCHVVHRVCQLARGRDGEISGLAYGDKPVVGDAAAVVALAFQFGDQIRHRVTGRAGLQRRIGGFLCTAAG